MWLPLPKVAHPLHHQQKKPRQSIRLIYLAILTSTLASPSSKLAICEKAARVKSIILPLTKGPLSLILTLTDLPLFIFLTITSVPKGKVLWAAVIARLFKRSPLAVFLL